MSDDSDVVTGMGKILKGRDVIATAHYRVCVNDKPMLAVVTETENKRTGHLRPVDCQLTELSATIPESQTQTFILEMNDGKRLNFHMSKAGPVVTGGVY